ncbi:MAG: two-component regulator propeller domain-containing protein [Chitinophagaceae bacterium]
MTNVERLFALILVGIIQFSCKEVPKATDQDKPRSRSANYSDEQLKEADTSSVPMSMVRHIKQARNGDILAASYLGVFRYNGTSFTNLTKSIVPTEVASFWDVLEDRNGNLWFGSKDSGVYVSNGQSVQHYTTKDGLASNLALHLYEDKSGRIWIGSTVYDGKSFRNYTTKDGFPSNNIRLLLEDKTGRLWFGAQAEDLFVYDGKTYTVLKDKDGYAFNNVWSVIEDQKGNIWFGGSIITKREGSTIYYDPGLWRYDGKTVTRVSRRGTYDIIQDREGNIWTSGGTDPQVWTLTRYDAKTLYDQSPVATEIRSGGVMAFLDILEASDGSIWYSSGGLQAGVHRYDGKTFTDFKTRDVKNE